MKKVFFIVLTIFMLVGCNNTSTPNIPVQTSLVTPKPFTKLSKDVLVLSYPDVSLQNLTRITVEKTKNYNNSIAKTTAYTLLTGFRSNDYYIPFGGKAYPISVDVSRNLIDININVDLSELSDKEIFASIVSLTNTLIDLDRIEYVKLSINGIEFPSTGILVNPITYQNENLYLSYLKHQDYINSDTGIKASLTKNHLLYFVSFSNKYLLTEVRTSYQDNENIALNLFNELKNGPAASNEMESPIPKNVVIKSDPQIHEDEAIGKILTISLEAPKHETIDNESRYMMAASIVNTIQSEMPEISGVRILINSQPIISTSIMDSSEFENILGNIVTLYFPDDNLKYLVPVKRAMSQSNFELAEERIKELIAGVLENDIDYAVSIFNDDVSNDDLLSIDIHDDIIFINFSQNFKDSCKLDSTGETLLIYSIVNTLTEFSKIKRVQFLIEGNIVDSLCGYLSIDQPLLPNPGIIQN